MKVISAALVVLLVSDSRSDLLPWSYKCDEYSRCVKGIVVEVGEGRIQGEDAYGMSLGACKLTCEEHAVLWPRPRESSLGKEVTAFNPGDIEFANKEDYKFGSESARMIERGIAEQVEWLKKKKLSVGEDIVVETKFQLKIHLDDSANDAKPMIKRHTNETYRLAISYSDAEKILRAEISAADYFGARHGLETLFQLMEYDDIYRNYIIVNSAEIRDYPEFRHRGISLDTSRNFIEADTIKRIIDGMGHSKLNVLHWHIVDTHSFPVEFKQDPINLMATYGAYDPSKIYSQDTIREIVQHANFRGVRVIPEFDQPAHVGNGWQFPGAEDLTVCMNQEPWYKWCVEPPCGQLDPTKEKVYDVLEMIYREFYDMFDFDSFHMGADEVHLGCWNSSSEIAEYMQNDIRLQDRSEQSFIHLWSDFQKKSSDRLKGVYKGDDLELIVWTSHLTKEKYIHELPNKEYAIHIWTNGSDVEDPTIKMLADKGYKMIFSNYDSLYLDCGYSAWVGEGNNWCTPYKGWQKIYGNDPYEMLEMRNVVLTEEKKKQVLGGEVAMWTEQVDTYSVESKIFPRADALAERLWSNPKEKWYAAEQRMLQQRWRLTHRGIMADALQPEWCRINSGQCYVKDDNPLPDVDTNK